MTAPTHLTDADREVLLTPCECGHDFNHHGDLAGCWTCPELEPPRECNVLGSELMARNVEAIVQRAVTAALNDAADAVAGALGNEVGGHTSTYSVRKWLRERALPADAARIVRART